MTEEYHHVSSNGNRENELPAVPGETCVTEMLSQVLSWVHAARGLVKSMIHYPVTDSSHCLYVANPRFLGPLSQSID